MKHTHHILLAIGSVILAAAPAAAGPWTPRAGHGQIILSTTIYATDQPFDADSDRRPFAFDGRFRKLEMNPYIEVGITDRLAVATSVFGSRQQFTNTFDSLSNSGLGDTYVNVRYRVAGDSGPLVMAVTGGVKLPTGKGSGAVRIADRQLDVDLGVAVGGSIGRSSRPPFWNVDAAYRERTDGPADEIKMDAAIGAYAHRRVMFIGQASMTRGLRNAQRLDFAGNPTLSPDYDLYRLQASSVISVTEAIRVQTGVFAHVLGRNTGSGGGVVTSLWVAF